MGRSFAALSFDTNGSLVMSSNMNAPKIEAFDRLVRDPRIRGADCRVAWLLICQSDDDLSSCSSHSAVARELRCSTRSVSRSVARLCALGWLTKVTGRGRSKSNEYQLKTENGTPMSPFTKPKMTGAA